METKSWKVELGGQGHDVKLLRTFDPDGHPAVIETRPARKLSKYFAVSLQVDGTEVEPEPGASGWEAPVARGGEMRRS